MNARAKTDAPGAVTSMVCGIISIAFACLPLVPLVLGIVALVMAKKAKETVQAEPEFYKEGGVRVAGFVCGIVGTVLGSIYTIYYLFAVIIFGTVGLSGLHGLRH